MFIMLKPIRLGQNKIIPRKEISIPRVCWNVKLNRNLEVTLLSTDNTKRRWFIRLNRHDDPEKKFLHVCERF